MQKNSLENLDDENIPLTKSKKTEKPNLKKVRSEKQIEAFNRTMEIRKQKINERKETKLLESAKLLLEKTALKNDQPKPSDKKHHFKNMRNLMMMTQQHRHRHQVKIQRMKLL